MSGELDGAVALVTGAAGGIGAAVVRTLAVRGAAVAAADRDGDAATALAEAVVADGGTAFGARVDVTDAAGVQRMVARTEAALGPLTVAVSVAGVLHAAPVVDTTDADWAATFAVNATGPFHLLRAAGRAMAPRGRGAIVVVGSNAASVPRAGMAAYAASKAAATMLARCAGLELAAAGVRCNVVSPGSTDTAMQDALWPDGSAARRAVDGSPEHFRVGIPLGRIAAPDDVAEAVAFLASDRARHITMHDLLVDGGATLKA
ncbi:2,3-dihydro-2,3-dihydroxybenzoate dehydrogenase [Baekduia alba]|uniref:2,3-dihydro-2,3-dihydroxybenzoate dehydrogenase n=1 Tax=Baekduia alba TaxID=2997333 RepID=UPI0023423A6A|nr:2,3-dihydro-2,3-dihydroxybenzoate dehydrogenase [Baekduia alba]WCB95232.1 2,3-dihydro-2,3-dihydroxybenzoate dehydrogenase [Baekduia alba]